MTESERTENTRLFKEISANLDGSAAKMSYNHADGENPESIRVEAVGIGLSINTFKDGSYDLGNSRIAAGISQADLSTAIANLTAWAQAEQDKITVAINGTTV